MLLEILNVTRSETHWAPPSQAVTAIPDDPSSPRALRSPRTPTRISPTPSLLHPPKYEGSGFIRLTGAAAEAWKACAAWQSALGVAGSSAAATSAGLPGEGATGHDLVAASSSPSTPASPANDGGRPTVPPILPSDSMEGASALVMGQEDGRGLSGSPSAVQGLMSARRSGTLGGSRTVRKKLVPVKVLEEAGVGRQGEAEAEKQGDRERGEGSSEGADGEAHSSSSISSSSNGSNSASSNGTDVITVGTKGDAGSVTAVTSSLPSPSPPSISPLPSSSAFSLYLSPPSSEDESAEEGKGKKKQPYRQSWVRALEGGTSSEEESTDNEREQRGMGEGGQGQGAAGNSIEGAGSQVLAGDVAVAGASGQVDSGQAGAGVGAPVQQEYAGTAAAARACQLPHVIVGGGPGFQPEHLLETELKFVVRVLRTFDPAEVSGRGRVGKRRGVGSRMERGRGNFMLLVELQSSNGLGMSPESCMNGVLECPIEG